jgi:hypothetical protein
MCQEYILLILRSTEFTDLCVRKFDRTVTRSMKFDDFIQCCVMLKTLTDAFRKHDTSQTGVVQINYEQVGFIQTCVCYPGLMIY